MIKLTKEQLIELRPCDLQFRLSLFDSKKALTAKQAIAAGVSIDDLLWVAQKLGHKSKCVEFALACAQHISYLYTRDERLNECLTATRVYINNATLDNLTVLRAKQNAAYAAATAAYAAADAAAAYAAAYAADAAADAAAAYAAATATAAAAAAAYAATAAAAATDADARQKELKWQQALFIKMF